MRITNSHISSNYTNILQRNLQNVYEANRQVLTGRRYDKTADDVANATRTRKLYHEYQKNEIYIKNTKTAQGVYDQADATVQSISELLNTAGANILEAISEGAVGEDERSILATQLRELQEQIVADLNMTYNGKYLFSGAATDEKPFEFVNGELLFRGINVNTNDPVELQQLQDMANETRYIDIGMGLQVTTNSSGINTVVPGTAFDTAFSALNFLGYGENANGYSNNIVVLMGEIADMLESPGYSKDAIDPLVDMFQSQQKDYIKNMTALGAKASYLETTQKRLEESNLVIQDRMDALSNIDLAEAAVILEDAKYQYEAALKIGSTILGMSLLDYLA